jgi:hypothetical protein
MHRPRTSDGTARYVLDSGLWTLDQPVRDIGWPQAGRGRGRPADCGQCGHGQLFHYRPGTGRRHVKVSAGRLRPALHLETMIST